MKNVIRCAIVSAALIPSAGVLAYDTPSTISSSDLSDAPYAYTGLVYYISGDTIYMGSGFLVGSNVFLTAAHVAFDDDTMSWVSGIKFDQAFNKYYTYLNGDSTTGTMYLSSYSTELAEFMKTPSYSSGTSDNDTFNSDIVAIYSTTTLSTGYGTYSIHREDEPALAAKQWEMMLLGYPMDEDYISESNIGKMHQSGPDTWSLTDLYGNNDGTYEVNGVLAALYSSDDFVSYSGNSGGPLFVYDDDDDFYTDVGIVVGGSITGRSAYTLCRIIDINTEDIIEEAIDASGASSYLLPPSISAEDGGSYVKVSWSDSSLLETGWEVRRNDGDAWNIVGTVASGTNYLLDTSAESGITYKYTVRPYRTLSSGTTNRGPWSARVSAGIGGANEALAKALGARYVYVKSEGDAPFYPASDSSVVYSGKILNNQESDMELTLTGPGTLTYTVVLSSESGDKLTVYLDGTSAASFTTSKTYSDQTLTVSSSGTHTVEFAYTKDSYDTSGSDNATITDLSYYCSDTAEAFQGGIVTSGNWRYSTIIGTYYDYGDSWTYSDCFGFAYMYPQSSASTWVSNQVQWAYVYGNNFGWCGFSMTGWPWMWSANKGWMYAYGDGWFWVWDDQAFEYRY